MMSDMEDATTDYDWRSELLYNVSGKLRKYECNLTTYFNYHLARPGILTFTRTGEICVGALPMGNASEGRLNVNHIKDIHDWLLRETGVSFGQDMIIRTLRFVVRASSFIKYPGPLPQYDAIPRSDEEVEQSLLRPDDPAAFADMRPELQATLLQFIRDHYRHAKTPKVGRSSYGMKHQFTGTVNGKRGPFYVTNGEFKGGMLAEGFTPVDPTEQNWGFRFRDIKPRRDGRYAIHNGLVYLGPVRERDE